MLICIIFEVLKPGNVSHSLWGVVFHWAVLHISVTINKHQLSYFPEDIFPQLTDSLLLCNNFSIDRRTKSTHKIHWLLLSHKHTAKGRLEDPKSAVLAIVSDCDVGHCCDIFSWKHRLWKGIKYINTLTHLESSMIYRILEQQHEEKIVKNFLPAENIFSFTKEPANTY